MKPLKPDKIYFVGAGPGDPDLLTVKARRIIRRADIIIYAGSLVSQDVVDIASAAARYDSSRMSLEEIFAIMEKWRRKNKLIVRLHSGDPCIYGAIQEQMDWCLRQGIDCEVVPGVSCYQAAAAGLRQELTLPGVSQTVILSRLSGRTRVPPKEDLSKLAQARATMAIFLSAQNINGVAKRLIAGGYKQETPVIVVSRVSRPDELRISGTLSDIALRLKEANIRRQAIIIVGNILNKRYRRSRLYGKDRLRKSKIF
ncbi:MAG: precorrin-4 C(11)-methyltransferase [Candidatus Omnitrophota bacterium]